MERRQFMTLSGVAALAAGLGTRAAAQTTPGDQAARIIRVYADADGESHIEDWPVALDVATIPVSGMRFNRYASGTNDWHLAPARQFAINIEGDIEAEASDGTVRQIGPGDLVWLEDTAGRGHVTRLVTPVTNLFINVPQDWDFVAWAAGEA